MTESEIAEIAAWIAEIGLKGKAEVAMLAGFCERLVAHGLPLARAMVLIDTLHPVYEGRAFRWRREDEDFGVLGGQDDDFAWPVVTAPPGHRIWTDDYSNILGAIVRHMRD